MIITSKLKRCSTLAKTLRSSPFTLFSVEACCLGTCTSTSRSKVTRSRRNLASSCSSSSPSLVLSASSRSFSCGRPAPRPTPVSGMWSRPPACAPPQGRRPSQVCGHALLPAPRPKADARLRYVVTPSCLRPAPGPTPVSGMWSRLPACALPQGRRPSQVCGHALLPAPRPRGDARLRYVAMPSCLRPAPRPTPVSGMWSRPPACAPPQGRRPPQVCGLALLPAPRSRADARLRYVVTPSCLRAAPGPTPI